MKSYWAVTVPEILFQELVLYITEMKGKIRKSLKPRSSFEN